MAEQEDDNRTVTFKVGRPVQHDNVQYGIGTYKLTPEVAAALKRKNAGAPVEQHLAAARTAPTEGATGSTAEFGGKPEDAERLTRDPDANNPLRDPALNQTDAANRSPDGKTGRDLEADALASTSETNDGGGQGINPSGGATGINPSGGAATAGNVEDLSGDLPNDFPRFEQLVAGNVTRYEQLTALKSDQLTALGVDEPGVQEISTRLYEDAQKSEA